jgi:hypothetical protein
VGEETVGTLPRVCAFLFAASGSAATGRSLRSDAGAEAAAIDAGGGALEEVAVDEGAKEPEGGGAGELGAVDDVGEVELFAGVAEGFEDLAGAEDGEGFIAVAAAGRGHWRGLLVVVGPHMAWCGGTATATATTKEDAGPSAALRFAPDDN